MTTTTITAPSLAGYDNVAEPFLESVRRDPQRAAVICQGRTFSYAELNGLSNQVYRLLSERGVRPGDKVAYLLPNCAMILAVYYAVQKLGAIAVPINVRSVAAELQYFLNASDASVLLFSYAYAGTVSDVQGQVPTLRLQFCVDGATPWCEDLRPLLRGVPVDEPELFHDPEAVSRIQFTGGSTGLPKGAMRTHRADLVEIEGTYGSNWLYADSAKVVLIQCPLEHHGGHAWFSTSLSLGATLVLCGSFDPETILTQIQRHGVSYMILLPPTTYVRLMSHPSIGSYDLSSVRLVQSSAGGTTPEIVSDIYRHFPNAIMNYGWGQTESGLGSSLVLTREYAEERLPRIESIGIPMPGIELKLVDDDDVEVPTGTLGECVARSAAVMRGYYNQPELTEQAFTADGWLRTGDLMVADADGYLYLKGRKRDLIKSGGENVFVGEVEQVIRRHPAVLDVMVYGRPDVSLGEAVAAVVELRPGAELTLRQLQDHCRTRLASFKKPRFLTVVDSLDRDFSGKLHRADVIRRSEQLTDITSNDTTTQ
jgi:acyl-CoA synthetase (AMP-forming)/AMP-acid ligase II